MNESRLLEHIARRSADLHGHGPVIVGPGDDCAVLRGSSGSMLITVDHLVEGRHYEPGTDIDLIARKAVARSVSDIAAMAGTPTWALATGALSDDMTQQQADELFERMSHWARHWGCPLVGGDIALMPRVGDTPGPTVLTVTVAGHTHPTRGPVLRSAARIGDDVYITGSVGASFSGGHHLRFEPRIAQAGWLADRLGDALGAMIDLSDGLGRDAGRVARASGVRIELDAARFPLRDPSRSPIAAAGDGEDYELLMTVRPGADLPDSIALGGDAPVPLTRIGRVCAGQGCVILTSGGDTIDATGLGWDHTSNG
ncbi:MAG: thiamine-phosphate kinase [Phycisphaerales bacterium]|jgi:thiamine-monophosphate kinase|nr:thiamine-phosphate kinase [Phycisphaeraceae bacterium]